MTRKLSIIITTKDRYELLLKCVESILNSSYKDFELIIIDDNSTDPTKDMKPSDVDHAEVLIYHATTKMMMVKARNKGIGLSKGEYVLFIDDDNIIDIHMIQHLVNFLEREPRVGISGPSMYYSNGTKYLDYQKINLYTGKTSGFVGNLGNDHYLSDGIPNVFIIRREVIDNVGVFDEALIQTYTEPDYSLSAKLKGYTTAIYPKAKTYHQLEMSDRYTSRALGGKYIQKAYCLMRNRTVLITRYGNSLQRLVYVLLFSWVWPLSYTLLVVIKERRFDLVPLYWKGWYDGVIYFLTGKLRRSI
ncbi:MAG: Glycosyl transferase family 2 [candidate division WWE3 bacterium GW2011_GWA1_43_94]|uniref:Glycosyltransferase 2-like domain-containing protein n=1 Tax=candidate division WWE3 bacterium TaxID=2053526 RepID=A0A3D0ZQA9_UNCKA|nr:MAG: Glycosyl transferase family 2 [Candidatus Moranbacteria bacterium GW2011_GWF2_36_839]KKS28831.1 MAG: Glycosyl transferase family 2 [candidate division WWE3 bacterium GW2011_GWB1_42_117]KKT26501.1 MAG: Glycosyl transferase family 2 [candidate division WWE3 bacterium GW2011_GWA1_43_94]OGC57989.1 MAG: hypothetical protein A2245_02740 [candidate division WWE3 bacterium RIFOXYA2_FULL_43_12]OGC75418.1 MAG: hypothetical protein A2547_02600 [candidate division WWE3 bacterium RIFOXYD2_FULL_43_10